MTALVEKYNGELVTTLQKVAEISANDTQSLQRLMRTHKKQLEKFGKLEFETIKTSGRPQKQYYLNEQQSYLFITFLKNSKEVVDFKIKLIEEFFRMKQELHSSDTDYKQLVLTQNTTIALLQKQLESNPKQIENKNPLQSPAFEELLKQTQEELDRVPTKDRLWYENRANHWIRVVEFIKEHGTDAQKAAAKLKSLEGKYNRLRIKIQSIQSFIHEAYTES